jgi:hypothetical protein
VDNLAYRSHGQLADGFTAILAGCRALLRPGGHVVVTARPYRRQGELIDIPGMVAAAGINAGLELVEECIALICGVRDGVIIPRASFFQQKNIGDAIASGDPQWLVQHEDVAVLRAPLTSTPPDVESPSARTTAHADRLDAFAPHRVDRRAQAAPPGNANPGGSAIDPRSRPDRDGERTSDPCPPYPHPTPGNDRPDPTTHRRSGDPHGQRSQLDSTADRGQQ